MAKKRAAVKKITVAKGVKISRGKIKKRKQKKGSSNVGKYKGVSPSDFAGSAGGADRYSFPINSLARARNALARAHFAPNPEGIEKTVYRRYPELKKRAQKRSKAPKKDNPGHAKKKVPKTTRAKAKVKTVMKEYKAGELNIGKSKKKVKSRKQAVAIALSEARKQ